MSRDGMDRFSLKVVAAILALTRLGSYDIIPSFSAKEP
jgi:hypothetical protein